MKWTVGRRIAAGFAFVLVLAFVLGLTSVVALRTTVDAFSESLRQERSVTSAALESESSSQEATLEFLRFMLEPEAMYVARRDSSVERSRRILQGLRDTVADPQSRLLWADAVNRLDEWDQASTASIAAVQAGDTPRGIAIWDERGEQARRDVRAAIDRAVSDAVTRGSSIADAAEATASRMELLVIVAGFVLLGLGILSGWLLNRAVTEPLRETSGILASSAAEILAATSQQASSASETSAAVAETSTTVDEVAETSRHANERARSVSDSAKRAAEIGKSGRQAVDDSVAAMAEVQAQVSTIAQSIVALAEQAQAIGEIIATVNDVAEQTNLLALNAAVEAARAGEHGRGFAVVAGEVRNLAEQSKGATVQVRRILGEIQAATNAAVMTTERGSQQVAAGSRQVNHAGETIRELADAVAAAAQAAAQIAASAGEQAVGMDQIRHAMGNVQEATQQTLASTRQAESAAADLTRMGDRLLDLVGRDGLNGSARRKAS